MNVVENRNKIWNKAKLIMMIMYKFSKIFISVESAKKILEKKRFKTGWYNMAWRFVLLKRIGTNFVGEGYRIIQSNVCIYNAEKLTMGERVTLNDNSYIECSGGVEIGNDVLIGHGVSILSNSHKFDDLDIPINKQGEKLGKIIIGDNVWIGAKVTILHGVTIGNNAIIGAHSLIKRDVFPNEVVGARYIRNRENGKA